MEPQEKFDEIMKVIAAAAKARGYRRKRQIFRKDAGEIIGVFSVDKSKWNTADCVEFRFAYDVLHTRYHELYTGSPFDATWCRPGGGVVRTHVFRKRDGKLTDFPWALERDTPIGPILADVEDALENVVFPEVEKLLTDEGLCEALLVDLPAKRPYVMDQRICLICLLQDAGRHAEMEEALRAAMTWLKTRNFPLDDFIETMAKIGIDAERYA